jgi:hypothetical protein
METVHDATRDPGVTPSAECGGGDRRIDDPVIGTPEDEDLDEFVEADAIGDPGAVTAEWVMILVGWQEHLALVPDRVDEP